MALGLGQAGDPMQANPFAQSPTPGFAPGPWPAGLDLTPFPAPPGFVFGNDPYSQEMQAAQNQAAMQMGYLGNVYGPYFNGMAAQGAALAPSANTPVLDRELANLKGRASAGKGKAAKAGMAVLDAQTRGAHTMAQGLATAGDITQAAQPGIADAAMSQAQNALYGPFSQQAVAIAGQQAAGQQQQLTSLLTSISNSISTGKPPTPEEIQAQAQLLGLSPDQTQALISYAASASAGVSSTLPASLASVNPQYSAVDQRILTYVQQSKGKTLGDVQKEVYGDLLNGHEQIPYWDPSIKAIIDREVAAIWTLQQQQANQQATQDTSLSTARQPYNPYGQAAAQGQQPMGPGGVFRG